MTFSVIAHRQKFIYTTVTWLFCYTAILCTTIELSTASDVNCWPSSDSRVSLYLVTRGESVLNRFRTKSHRSCANLHKWVLNPNNSRHLSANKVHGKPACKSRREMERQCKHSSSYKLQHSIHWHICCQRQGVQGITPKKVKIYNANVHLP